MTPTLDPQQVTRMLDAARDAQRRAHAPYSRFHVGAAVLDESGRVHAGCNVENAAYPLGICAETVALGMMVAAGGKNAVAMLVVGEGDNLVPPCGGCRQWLYEWRVPEVSFRRDDGTIATYSAADLLPETWYLPE